MSRWLKGVGRSTRGARHLAELPSVLPPHQTLALHVHSRPSLAHLCHQPPKGQGRVVPWCSSECSHVSGPPAFIDIPVSTMLPPRGKVIGSLGGGLIPQSGFIVRVDIVFRGFCQQSLLGLLGFIRLTALGRWSFLCKQIKG